MSVTRSSPVALYRQVADDLVQTYVNGHGGGARLPTEAELAVHYGVSRITIRQALGHLADRGLIVRTQGKGTFVSEPRIHQDLQRLAGFHDSLVEHNIIPVTRLLEYGPRQAPPRVQQILRLSDPGACFLKRQYLVDGRPLAVGEVYMPPRFLETVSRETAEQHPSYALLRQFGGVTIDRAEVTIRAQQAEGDLAGLLGVPSRAATMVLERLTYAATGEPCEHTTLYLRADAYEFGLTIDGGVSLAANIRAIPDEAKNRASPASSDSAGD
jgi:GntR family transcriptional regulator